MPHHAPIEIIHEPVDPLGKQGRGVRYAHFRLSNLGPLAIEGMDTPDGAQWVRLPPDAEPGCIYELVPNTRGGVMLAETSEGHPTLLDAPRVLVGDDLCVWLIEA